MKSGRRLLGDFSLDVVIYFGDFISRKIESYFCFFTLEVLVSKKLLNVVSHQLHLRYGIHEHMKVFDSHYFKGLEDTIDCLLNIYIEHLELFFDEFVYLTIDLAAIFVVSS